MDDEVFMIKWAANHGPVWVTGDGELPWATLIAWYSVPRRRNLCRIQYPDGTLRTVKKHQVQPIKETGAS